MLIPSFHTRTKEAFSYPQIGKEDNKKEYGLNWKRGEGRQRYRRQNITLSLSFVLLKNALLFRLVFFFTVEANLLLTFTNVLLTILRLPPNSNLLFLLGLKEACSKEFKCQKSSFSRNHFRAGFKSAPSHLICGYHPISPSTQMV